MRWGLVSLLLLAGCDWVLRLDQIDVPDATVDDITDYSVHCQMDDAPAAFSAANCSGMMAACGLRCPSSIQGRFGMAYSFTGSESFELAPTNLLGGTNGYTLSAWILPAPDMIDMAIVTKDLSDAAVNNAFNLVLVKTGGTLEFETSHSGMADYVGPGAVSVRDGVWHHVAALVDQTTVPPTKRLYIDGLLVGMRQVSVDDSARTTWIGVDHDATIPVGYYRGGVDELRIYPRALDAREINKLAR